MRKPSVLPESEIVEVVIKKKIPYKEYLKIIDNTKQRGWKIQAYQVGRFSDGFQKPIEENG